MKKNIFLFLLLAIIAMSCQKDIEPNSVASVRTNEIAPTATKQTSLFDEDKPIENDDVFKKIDAFKAKIANIEAGTMPETDNGTTINDVIWNIEALMNSNYGQANKPFASQSINSAIIRIPLNANNLIDNAALISAIEATRLKLRDQYNTVSGSDKHIIAIDVSLASTQPESGYANLSIGSSVGIEEPQALGAPYVPFGGSDNWFYGENLGKCDGSFAPKDAATQISEKVNSRSPLSADIFFTDVQSIFAAGEVPILRNPNDIRDNNRDFFLFLIRNDLSADEASFNAAKCINSDDMNWYYQSALTVISLLRPSGKTFTSLQLFGEPQVFGNSPLVLGHVHLAQIFYGIKRRNINPRPCC
jgi:hypothetical protein